MARQIDAARERLTRRALAGWSGDDVQDLARSLRRFANALAVPEASA
jgi:acyl-CoA reductase-like NAD-dependent aldehyde dehydrogenase